TLAVHRDQLREHRDGRERGDAREHGGYGRAPAQRRERRGEPERESGDTAAEEPLERLRLELPQPTAKLARERIVRLDDVRARRRDLRERLELADFAFRVAKLLGELDRALDRLGRDRAERGGVVRHVAGTGRRERLRGGRLGGLRIHQLAPKLLEARVRVAELLELAAQAFELGLTGRVGTEPGLRELLACRFELASLRRAARFELAPLFFQGFESLAFVALQAIHLGREFREPPLDRESLAPRRQPIERTAGHLGPRGRVFGLANACLELGHALTVAVEVLVLPAARAELLPCL